ncbi:MAG TPA: hypothetical protein VMN58_08590 [Acidimicrobiales bacterium]|nr:hypothetical protein [Acidimicrobiales bacterium]
MIAEALAALSTKALVAAAAGTLAVTGASAVVVANAPDDAPVSVEAEAQDDENRQDDGAGQDADNRRDGEDETDDGPPEGHGATVSEAAKADYESGRLRGETVSGIASEKGADARGENGVEEQEAGQANQPDVTPAGPAEAGSQAGDAGSQAENPGSQAGDDGDDETDADREDGDHRPETPAGPPAE